jgi:hypothetical protein
MRRILKIGRSGDIARGKWPVFAGLALFCAVVAALGAAIPSQGGVVNNPEACNPTGRLFCMTLGTFSNVTASSPALSAGKRYTWVEWSMRNASGSTLTHPTITVSLADVCGTAGCNTATSAFVLPASPDICSPIGSSLVCTYPNLASGASTATTRVYFKTADAPATSSVIRVQGTAKERTNDANPCGTDPNCDTFATSIVNSYEPEPNAAYSFALDGKRFHLATDNELSSFEFTSASAAPFLAQLQVQDHSTAYCFGTVPCFDRTLLASTQAAPGFSAANPVVFYARLVNPPSSVNQNTLSAIHFYDPVTLQANATTNRFTGPAGTSFARIDGVSFDAGAASVIAAGTYFVVGYQLADNSFQVSATKGGPAVTLLSSLAVSGGPIRVIGDQNDERSTTSCTTTPATINFPVPSICVLKVKGQNAFDNWVWDAGNGRVGW